MLPRNPSEVGHRGTLLRMCRAYCIRWHAYNVLPTLPMLVVLPLHAGQSMVLHLNFQILKFDIVKSLLPISHLDIWVDDNACSTFHRVASWMNIRNTYNMVTRAWGWKRTTFSPSSLAIFPGTMFGSEETTAAEEATRTTQPRRKRSEIPSRSNIRPKVKLGAIKSINGCESLLSDHPSKPQILPHNTDKFYHYFEVTNIKACNFHLDLILIKP